MERMVSRQVLKLNEEEVDILEQLYWIGYDGLHEDIMILIGK